jgi:predicted aminopeptidase
MILNRQISRIFLVSQRTIVLAWIILLPLVTSGCTTIGYYKQAVQGHLQLMRARQPVEQVIKDQSTSPELREKLQTLLDARVFAVEALGLPENDSYSTFVETGKSAITWNVVATEEFSLNPKTWCFPVAGCVSYRGYFDRADADAYANELKAENLDVTIGGATAYSTLGWFEDPILDTMLRGRDYQFVGILFHELAHQQLYVKDDSDFNEAFATFVEQEGARQWLEYRGQSDRITEYEDNLTRAEGFVSLLRSTRQQLVDLYRQELDEDSMRQQKAAVFSSMRDEYEQLKISWNGYSGYDGWFKREINNARLIAVSTYRRFVPAFMAMYIEAGEDLEKFYEVAQVTAELPADERRERMSAYLSALRATSRATASQ